MDSGKIRGAAAKVLARRPDLAARLRDAGVAPDRIDALARARLGAGLEGGLEAATLPDPAVANMPLSVGAALESIIEEIGRPTLFVNGSDFDLPAEEDLSRRLRAARAAIAPALRSVGRVEVFDGSVKWSVATAWMIAENIAITNRHVAEKFATLDTQGRPVLLTDLRGRPYKVVIDFREEHGSPEESEIVVDSVLYLPPRDGRISDIALLRVTSGPHVPPPIPLLGERLTVDRWVAVVGYPQPDDRIPPEAREVEESYFSNIYGVKRLSPGQIDDVRLDGAPSWIMAHDATTLGGNSASVVLDLATGSAAGIHFKGVFKTANYAIDSLEIRRVLTEHGIASVNVSPAPRPASPGVLDDADDEAAEDFSRFKGYVADFISRNGSEEFEIPLPDVSDARHGSVAQRLDGNGIVLNYRNFSVVMNEKRRMCYFSAVNIDGKRLFSISGARPTWKFDRRLAIPLQVKDECYGEAIDGKFSRGHMTRREDPNWGRDRDEAVISNRHTFYVTNACPQMQPFNAGLWLRLEEYALENCDQDDMRISVFTGPIFNNQDKDYFGVKVPVEFWKIIAFKHDETGSLSATAYKMSQRDVLPTEEEFVFGQFRSSQVTIRHVESLTGLSFHHLREHDPFDDDTESLAVRTLRTPNDIVFK